MLVAFVLGLWVYDINALSFDRILLLKRILCLFNKAYLLRIITIWLLDVLGQHIRTNFLYILWKLTVKFFTNFFKGIVGSGTVILECFYFRLLFNYRVNMASFVDI